ncbi:MAG TPA: DUF4388 domain-containing protein [Myxococcota bacterium]|nr:DUF4388 domain-containing protein [Myxococcota bacterium]
MSAGLSGNLSDFGIADVFQLIGQQRKTGALELRTGAARAQLHFDRGLVVSAAIATGRAGELDPLADRLIRGGYLTRERADEAIAAARASTQTLARTLVARGLLDGTSVRSAIDLVTRDAIFDVLRWQTGTFDFHAQSIDHERDAAELLGAEQILMDGLRMVDEWQSFAKLVPSQDTVFTRIDSSHSARGVDAVRVLALIDGRLSVRRVIDLARLSTFDGMRILSELRQAGAIRAVAAEEAPPLRRRARAAMPELRALGRAAAALLPLAALAVVAGWAAPAHRAPPADQSIERTALAALREDYAMRAVRNAMEAYRLAHGSWPERLEDLVNTGLIPPETLATLGGCAYYSNNREQGPIFLAPERS